ncbi:MAG: 23S rRNA (guanosine(2251)-2'-O)-methyltransferase RlmB [Myxococcaceae bacterium]|nr:23S rRNA (guanosine(2251)-2'-O)-methyltransferase RlmB [Myxococcaceae bacterium]
MSPRREREGRRSDPPRRPQRPEPRPRTSDTLRAGGRYVWGINPVLEALRAKPEQIEALFVVEGQLQRGPAAEIFSRAREAGVRTVRVARERLATMAEGGVHQGVVAEVRAYEYVDLGDLLERAKDSERPPLIVLLDGVQDPHNFGAIIRSAYALGAHGVVIPKDRSVQVTGTVAKASAGAIEHIGIARVTNLARALEQLKEAGLWIAAADPEGDATLFTAQLDGPLALVVGAEGAGVRRNVLQHCDFRVRIPMVGEVASLNASVSAAILLYEVARQRAGRAP